MAAKRLREIATGDVYPWSASWAKDPRFEEIDVVEMVAPEPTINIVNDKPGKKSKKIEDDL